MTPLLVFCARHGRWLLIAGLLLGIAQPALARAMAQTIVPLIAFMLFLAALRIGPRAAFPARAALPRALALTVGLQLVLPLVAGGGLAAAGLLHSIAGTGAVLVLAGAPITGAPGLAIMARADPATALRQLVLGTALLPLTAAPVFALLPVFDGNAQVAAGAIRLLSVIAAAAGFAMLGRRLFPVLSTARAAPLLDGLMALGMALVVIGLMAAVGPALLSLDPSLPGLLALAFALNLSPALILRPFSAGRRPRGPLPAPHAAALAIVAGNRNLALFLAALPPETVARLLLFVGLYQVPMYLTPLILPRLFRGLR
ncbi:hypothetical protein [Brevirhabdus sp.]|uniref:hypothetical protein n=1 Tax=Brevirhabdus sp. TaxID=2004514 RepID=UPI0040593767